MKAPTDRALVLGVFVVALLLRLAELASGEQVRGIAGFDQSVYYSAADALLHGRWLYTGDVAFIHPPGIALVGMPFALIGSWQSAHTGFLLANVAFSVAGAATAALVVAISRQWGCPRVAAVGAGLFYAVWVVAVTAESSMRLEPLGNLVFALGIWQLGSRAVPARRSLVLAGVAFGVLVNVKVWWVVPVAVLVALTAARWRRWAVLAVPAAVGAATAVVIALPFLLVSHGRMFRAVALVPLHRSELQWLPGTEPDRISTLTRLAEMTGVSHVLGLFVSPLAALQSWEAHTLALVVAALFVVTGWRAWSHPLGRLAVPLLAVQALVLLTAPIYQIYYGAFVAVPAALVIAAGAVRGEQPMRARAIAVPAAWSGVAAVTVLLTFVPGLASPLRPAPDRQALARAVKGHECVVADSPRLLIEADALDRSFASGCRNVVDLQAVMYGAGPDPKARAVLYASTPSYRRFTERYLLSGDAVMLTEHNVLLKLAGPRLARRLQRQTLLTRTGPVVVYRVDGRVRQQR